MTQRPATLFVRRLDLDGGLDGSVDLTLTFRRLQQLPHCVWLDSASDHQYDRGRYSFLSADPVAWCRADMDSPNPWPMLQQWCRKLSHRTSQQPEGLPPFCGGIVASLAYEAAWWLEPSLRGEGFATGGAVGRPEDKLATGGAVGRPEDKLATGGAVGRPWLPGMAIGLYDWTIAVDHQCGHVWLLSTGLDETFRLDERRARLRAQSVMRWIETTVPDVSSDSAHDKNDSSCALPSATVTSNFTDEQFAAGVAEIIAGIQRGDCFQVNLAQTLSHPATCEPSVLYQRLRRINPAPYACYFDAGDYQVISSSPEGFLQVRTDARGEQHVVTRPIKGTVARTGDAVDDARLGEELLASEKDRAENIMIVDLMRNDLSRVCCDESVQVSGLCELERYQRVQHLVSTVCGVLGPDASVADLLAACFPGGSITGAPKVEAMRTIARLEQRPRGPYCGSLGYISLSGAADFNILIRTVTQRLTEQGGAIWEFPVGGGITAQSDPQQETQETWVKAASLLEAITGAR